MKTIANRMDQLKWWQIALISIAVSALGSLSGLSSSKRQKKLYDDKLKQAPWAPPEGIFAPAWTINNFFILSALSKIISKDIPEKRKLILLQAGIWFIFFSFNYMCISGKKVRFLLPYGRCLIIFWL